MSERLCISEGSWAAWIKHPVNRGDWVFKDTYYEESPDTAARKAASSCITRGEIGVLVANKDEAHEYVIELETEKVR